MTPVVARHKVQDRSVLIVTHSAEIAQLLAHILEAGGYVPDIAQHRDALLRTASITHPALILVDCDHPSIHDVDGLPPSARAALVLFSPSRLADEVRLVAERYQLPSIALPVGPRALLQFVRHTIDDHELRAAALAALLAREQAAAGDSVSAA